MFLLTVSVDFHTDWPAIRPNDFWIIALCPYHKAETAVLTLWQGQRAILKNH